MKALSFAIILFMVIVWLPVEAAWSDYCFNNYDLGIYAQAIQLLSMGDPNPWLSVRDVFLFNDHFDPILFFTIPVKNLMPPGLLAIRIEMLSILISAFAPVWLARRGLISWSIGVCAALIILFSPLTLDAAFYPAHPGTWSVAPLSWMFAFILAERFTPAGLMLLLTLFCKEEYPFVGIAVGAVLWFEGRKKISLRFAAMSVIWAIGVFIVRPRVLGPASMYTDAVSHGQGISMLTDPDGLSLMLRRGIEMSLPLLPLLIGRVTTDQRRSYLFPAAVLLVLLMIRLAGGYWGNHRVAPLGVVTAFLAVFYLQNTLLTRTRLIGFGLCLLALAWPSLELGSRNWRGKSFKKHCPAEPARLASLNAAAMTLRERTDGAVLAQGNLIPPLVDLPGIAHVGATNGAGFRYLLIEKNNFRNTWPVSPEEFQKIERSWTDDPNVSKIIDDDWVLLLERASAM